MTVRGFERAVGRQAQPGEAPEGVRGAGVLEVVQDHQRDTYRAVYTIKYPRAVYVLHCFQKKSSSGIATPKPDVSLIEQPLKAVAALERA
jgi:phage-related protein